MNSTRYRRFFQCKHQYCTMFIVTLQSLHTFSRYNVKQGMYSIGKCEQEHLYTATEKDRST